MVSSKNVMLCYVIKLPQASHITANLIPVSHYGLGAATLAVFRNAHVQRELSALRVQCNHYDKSWSLHCATPRGKVPRFITPPYSYPWRVGRFSGPFFLLLINLFVRQVDTGLEEPRPVSLEVMMYLTC